MPYILAKLSGRSEVIVNKRGNLAVFKGADEARKVRDGKVSGGTRGFYVYQLVRCVSR